MGGKENIFLLHLLYRWAWYVFNLKQQNAFHGFLDNGFNLTLYSNLEGFIEGLRDPTMKVVGTVHLERLKREVRRRNSSSSKKQGPSSSSNTNNGTLFLCYC